MDERTLGLLGEILRRESRTLLQYASEAFPWIGDEERNTLTQIRQMVSREQLAVHQLSQMLIRHHHSLPYVGSFPLGFTTMNFVSLEHLLPLLAQHQEADLAQVRRELEQLRGTQAEEALKGLAKLKENHLQALQQLAAVSPAVHSTVH